MRRRNVIWTSEMDEYLVKRHLAGDTFDEICRILEVGRGSAFYRFRKLMPNAPYIPCQRKRVHSMGTRDAVIRMKLAGKMAKVIAAELDLNVNQVQGIWWQWNNFLFTRRQAA